MGGGRAIGLFGFAKVKTDLPIEEAIQLQEAGHGFLSGGSVYLMGENIADYNVHPEPFKYSGTDNVVSISGGNTEACYITDTEILKCFGQNSTGLLGNNTTDPITSPLAVHGATQVRQVDLDLFHACYVNINDQGFCSGKNNKGQLGDQTTSDSSIPVPITAYGAAIKQVKSGKIHTCVLNQTNEVHCWGGNGFGQLGNGTTIASSIAVDTGLTDVSHLVVGDHVSCAQKSNGKVFCWGGLGSVISSTSPTEINELEGVTDLIYIREYGLCGILGEKQILCVSQQQRSYDSQNNATNTQIYTTPTKIVKLSVSARQSATLCYIDTGSDLYCEGKNVYGYGAKRHYNSPVAFPLKQN